MYMILLKYIKLLLLFIAVISLNTACNYAHPQLTPIEVTNVQKQVNGFMQDIAGNVSAKGPKVWAAYIIHAPGFFMANQGSLVFKNDTIATAFMQDSLPKMIKQITLTWSGIHVDALTDNIASIGSDYHEDITGPNGKTAAYNGYFTATALLINDKWKLKNMHWSYKTGK